MYLIAMLNLENVISCSVYDKGMFFSGVNQAGLVKFMCLSYMIFHRVLMIDRERFLVQPAGCLRLRPHVVYAYSQCTGSDDACHVII